MTLKSLNLEFQHCTLTPEGILGPRPEVDRMGVRDVRNQFTEALSRIYLDSGLSDIDRITVAIMAGYWTTMVMKLAWASRLQRRTAEQGLTVLPSLRLPFLTAIMNDEQPGDDIWSSLLRRGPDHYPSWRWPLRLFRNLLVRIPIKPWPRRLIDFTRCVAVTTTGRLIYRHAETVDEPVVFVDAGNWFLPVADLALEKKSDLGQMCAQAALGILNSSPPQAEWLKRQINCMALAVGAHAERLLRHPKVPRTLWIGSNSSPWQRLLAAECVRRGGRVVAHDHGTGSGRFTDVGAGFVTKGYCSEFLTFQSHNKRWTEITMAGIGPRSIESPEISCLPDCAIQSEVDFATPRNAALSDSGAKRVLFVPMPLVGERMHLAPYPDDLNSLDFAARVVGALLAQGCQVALKPHPEFPFPALEQWKGFPGLTLDTRKFENALNDYEQIVVGYQNSSIIGTAASCDRPTTILSHENCTWLPEARAYFEEKFAIIECQVSPSARLTVDLKKIRKGSRRSSPAGSSSYGP